MTDHLTDNGDTLAHVMEEVVAELHAAPNHGPQLGERKPIEFCPMPLCTKWRRYLVSRFTS